MPIISALGGASAKAYGFTSSKSPYFIADVLVGGLDPSGTQFLLDGTSVVVSGQMGDAYIYKKDADWNTTWARKFTITSGNEQAANTVKDSSGNYFFFGYNPYTPYIWKYDSSGGYTTSYKYVTSGSGTEASVVKGGIDSSNNMYVGGLYYFSGTTTSNDGFLMKVNSSGTVQWALRIYDSFNNPNDNITGVQVSSGGDVYISNGKVTGNTTAWMAVHKFNTSGTHQWTAYFNGSGVQSSFATDLHLNSNGVYVCGDVSITSSGNNSDIAIAKLDTSGNVGWTSRLYNSSTQNETLYELTSDSSGNLYGGGYDASNNLHYIIKWNSSGTVQWQRSISALSAGAPGIAADSNYVYFATREYIFKLPTDGSKTGTYNVNGVSITYAASSLTATTFSTTTTTTAPTVQTLTNPTMSTPGTGTDSTTTVSEVSTPL